MDNLSDEEREEIRQMLGSFDNATVNLMALDRKYDKQWYAQQVLHLKEMDRYFAEVAKVMEVNGKNDVQKAADHHRDKINQIMAVYEDALKDIEKTEPIWKPRQ